jgi:hypothetical protein
MIWLYRRKRLDDRRLYIVVARCDSVLVPIVANVIASLALVLLLASCGGGGGGAVVRPAAGGIDDASRWSDDLIRDVRAGNPDDLSGIAARTPPTTLESEAARLADETQDIAVSAFCAGVTDVVNTGELPTYDEWRSWAAEQFSTRLTGYPFDLEAYVEGKANELAATIELVQANPQLARLYVERCRLLGL